MNIDWGNVGSLLAVIVTFITMIIAWKKYPHEIKNTENEAADVVTDAAIKLLKPLQDRIDELEAEKIDMEKVLKARIKELDGRVRELEKQLKLFEDTFDIEVRGAKKLYHQVRSLGGIPVHTPPGIDKEP